MAGTIVTGTLDIRGLHLKETGMPIQGRTRRSLAPIPGVQGTALSALTSVGYVPVVKVSDAKPFTGVVGDSTDSTGSPPRKAPV